MVLLSRRRGDRLDDPAQGEMQRDVPGRDPSSHRISSPIILATICSSTNEIWTSILCRTHRHSFPSFCVWTLCNCRFLSCACDEGQVVCRKRPQRRITLCSYDRCAMIKREGGKGVQNPDCLPFLFKECSRVVVVAFRDGN